MTSPQQAAEVQRALDSAYAAQFSITPLPEVRELTWAEAVRLIAQQEQPK